MLVDHVKVVIKSGKKHSSEEKLRALVLLDKCVTKASSNQEFILYVQKKVMDRLRIMAAHCPKTLSVSNLSHLEQRGETVFLPDEPAPAFASEFLRRLLLFIQTWAERFPEEKIFPKVYADLKSQQVVFPHKKKESASRKTEMSRVNQSMEGLNYGGGRSNSNPRDSGQMGNF